MSRHWKFVGKEVVECKDGVLEWAQWFETADRHVAKTELDANGVKLVVSTVFLGIDHNFGMTGDQRPILFETMIYSPRKTPEDRSSWDDCQWRYRTYDEAERCHNAIVAMLRDGQDPTELSRESLLLFDQLLEKRST
jgi:hypothetical protein